MRRNTRRAAALVLCLGAPGLAWAQQEEDFPRASSELQAPLTGSHVLPHHPHVDWRVLELLRLREHALRQQMAGSFILQQPMAGAHVLQQPMAGSYLLQQPMMGSHLLQQPLRRR